MGKAADKAGDKANGLARAEHEATGHLAQLADHPFVKAVTPLAKAADQPPLLVLSAATLAAGIAMRRPLVIRTGARMLASQIVATGLKTVLKASVDRTRPGAVKERASVGKGSGTGDKTQNAFPSGHTAGAIAVAQAIAHEVPRAAWPARGIAALAGSIQVPRGAHYISDVVAGAATGWLSERIAAAALKAAERRLGERRRVGAEAEVEAHPS